MIEVWFIRLRYIYSELEFVVFVCKKCYNFFLVLRIFRWNIDSYVKGFEEIKRILILL